MVIQVDLKEGSTLEDTDRTLRTLSNSLKDLPELLDMQLYVGQGAPFNFNGLVRHSYLRQKPELGELQLNFLPKSERKRESHAIALDIRNRFDTLSLNQSISVKVLEVPPGPPVLSTLLAEVYGPTASVRRDVAKALKEIFKSIDFIKDVDDSIGEPAPKMTLVIDQEKLNHYHVDEKSVYSALNAVFSSNRVGYSYRGDGKYPIDMTIELPKSEKTMSERVLSTLVPAKDGFIELGELIKVTFEKTSNTIFRHNGYDADLVMAELAGSFEAPLYGMLAVNNAIDSYDWKDLPKPKILFHGQPENELYPTLLWDGEWEITYVTFRDMGAAFILAIFGIYALLVAQFKSYRTPIVILLPIPLVLIGIIVGHWLLKAPFTATSMIGLIALAGIVVRNSLLLVEFIRHRLEKGDALVDALIKAGSTRITPIFLTAAAAMIGAVFMFFDPIFQGLAISLFFGLMSSTLLTLFAIPALYIVAKTK
jgi:multidrug efflux pump subunit AcrB